VELERAQSSDSPQLGLFDQAATFAAEISKPLELDPLREALSGMDPDRLSPREALEMLYRLKALDEK